MNMIFRPTVLAAALLSALLASCGGGGGSSGSFLADPPSGSPDQPSDPTGPTGPTGSLSTYEAASIAIGQPDFLTGTPNTGGLSASSLNRPTGRVAVAADGRVFVADSENNRVVAYSGIPGSMGAQATLVLGQPDFLHDDDGQATPVGMSRPSSVAIANNVLLVSDRGSGRVEIWNPIPTISGMAPNVFVGKEDGSSSFIGCDGSHLEVASEVFVTPQGKLIVVDDAQHRILVWNAIPSQSGQAADLVLGQADPQTCGSNRNGNADANTLSAPEGVWSDGTRLVVADSGNNRVLVWNSFPTQNGQAADLVLGQNLFTNTIANDDNQDGNPTPLQASNRVLNMPFSVASDGTRLAVADNLNNRVLVWNAFPTSNFAPADIVLGQADFTHVGVNASGPISAKGLRKPSGLAFIGGRLLIQDRDNNRIMVMDAR